MKPDKDHPNNQKELKIFRKNNIIRKYVERFDDGCGHIADITKLDLIAKKATRKTKPNIGFVLQVKWLNT